MTDTTILIESAQRAAENFLPSYCLGITTGAALAGAVMGVALVGCWALGWIDFTF